MADRRVTEHYIAIELDISQDCIHVVIHNEHQQGVPKFLGYDLKQTRFNMSRENPDPNSFFQIFLTMDETWVHHLRPGTKQQSKHGKHVGSPPAKEAKTVMQAGQNDGLHFCDAEGVVMVDYLDKAHTITGAYYADLLRQLRENVKKIRRGKLTS